MEIKICEEHPDYKVPLIWTFAFPRKEYWCPYCGYTGGMLGAGVDAELSDELGPRVKIYLEKSKNFLRAKAAEYAQKIMWEDEWFSPSQLPEEAKQFFEQARQDWKYQQEAELMK